MKDIVKIKRLLKVMRCNSRWTNMWNKKFRSITYNKFVFSFVISLCGQIMSINCDMVWSATAHVLSCVCHCVWWCEIGLISLSLLSAMISIRISIEANIKPMIKKIESYMTSSATKLTNRSISTMTTFISSAITISTFASLITVTPRLPLPMQSW